MGLPPEIVVDSAFTLPQEVKVAHYGPTTDGRYLAFGIEPTTTKAGSGYGSTADTPRSTGGGRYGIISLERATLTLLDPGLKAALTDYVSIVRVSGQSHLIRVEAVEQPPSACPDLPITCYDWAITSQSLPSGAPKVIMQGRGATAATDVPQPQAVGGAVYWAVISGGKSQVWAYRPNAQPVKVGAPLPAGILSVTQNAVWEGTPPGRPEVWRMPLTAGPIARIGLPASAGLATAADRHLAFRVDNEDHSHSVCVASLPAPHDCRRILQAQDVYLLYWISDSDLIASTPDGYELVSVSGTHVPLPLNYLYLVHRAGHQIAFMEELDSQQILVVAHVR